MYERARYQAGLICERRQQQRHTPLPRHAHGQPAAVQSCRRSPNTAEYISTYPSFRVLRTAQHFASDYGILLLLLPSSPPPPAMPPADFDSIWSPAKVFSPTAAKQASLQQKEWAYVDQFLVSRFAPAPVPKFERNPDTLKALLAIASANEAADEEKLLERRVKERALEELKKQEAEMEAARVGEPLLVAVEEHLTDDGKRNLNSMALLSVALASSSTDPQRYGILCCVGVLLRGLTKVFGKVGFTAY